MKTLSIILTCLFITPSTYSQDWEINEGLSIVKKNPKTYKDNIEMAGKKVAGIIYYDIDSLGGVSVEREIIYPQLKRHIQDKDNKWAVYRAYLKAFWKDDVLPVLYVDGLQLNLGKASQIKIDGKLIIEHAASIQGVEVRRKFYPSSNQRLFIERWELVNASDSIMKLEIGNTDISKVKYGPYGKYTYGVHSKAKEKLGLASGERYYFDIEYTAHKDGDETIISAGELEKREKLISKIHDKFILKTPNEELNTLFAFSKIRAAENIFDSKMGIVHSPGGGRYYTGVWANDQAEYSGPFFPYLGLEDGNIAALNAYDQFYNQMKTIPNHDKNLWASYEMSGDHTCCGTDRGDAAMIAFGGLHYLLAFGDKDLCKEYEPMIDWCLTYCNKMLNSEGVVKSESDEMEGRIPTGDANLSTSSLYYGALDLAIGYYSDLGYGTQKIESLKRKKKQLGKSIEDYFGSNVEGLETYKYFKEHTYLRHWICLPLVVGIMERKDATVEALFDRLWTKNGVHVEKNSDNPDISKIFWDRGTLYALRGTIIAGETELSLQKLKEFSHKRLLGDRVPYVVEAYPEGNMAHLSAESALYCRVFTEGIFGIKPTGVRSFDLTPRLPNDWDQMSLEKVMAYGMEHDISISRVRNNIEVKVIATDFEFVEIIKDGETVNIKLPKN